MEHLPKLVRRRLDRTEKPVVHPDPNLLAAFAERSLNDRERSQVLQHLADCADCRDVMSLAVSEIEPTPLPTAESSRWPSWPVLRWGALAACVMVVGAAVTLHHEPRQTEAPVAEKAPAASPSITAKKNVQQQPLEKLAINAPPAAPLQADRDLHVAAGKLAKQREMTIDPAGHEASTTPALRRDEKDRELINNRLADAAGLKSADKQASSAGAQVAAAPAAKAAPAPQPEVRNDAANSPPPVAAESVTVEADAPVLETSQTSERKTKDDSTKNESQKKELQAARAGTVSAMAIGNRKTDSLSAEEAQSASRSYAKRAQAVPNAPRWTLSNDGVLQRSFDSGKTWQTIPVKNGVVFRALAANYSDIWVGGAASALYHSSDAGQHWVQVNPVADGRPLTADIVAIEFSDAQHGQLTTSNRDTWTTSDAGVTWQNH
jgi:hypothetical protein